MITYDLFKEYTIAKNIQHTISFFYLRVPSGSSIVVNFTLCSSVRKTIATVQTMRKINAISAKYGPKRDNRVWSKGKKGERAITTLFRHSLFVGVIHGRRDAWISAPLNECKDAC